MKVIIEIPDVTVTLASALIAQECANNNREEALIKEAVKNCNETTCELNLKNIVGEDAMQMNIALAMFAINTELQKLK